MSLFALTTTLGLYFSAVFDSVVQILGSTIGSVQSVWNDTLAHYAAVFTEYGEIFPQIAQPLTSLWNGTTIVFNSFSYAVQPFFWFVDFLTNLLEYSSWTLPFVEALRDTPIIALLVASGVVVCVILMVFGALISFAKMLLSYLPLPG